MKIVSLNDEKEKRWAEWRDKESQFFEDDVRTTRRDKNDIVRVMLDAGFSPDELGRFYDGEKISIFDRRMQKILHGSVRHRQFMDAKTMMLGRSS